MTRAADEPQQLEFQVYWRCAHYPSAFQNFFEKKTCAHGCHATELRWFDHGVNKPAVGGERP